MFMFVCQFYNNGGLGKWLFNISAFLGVNENFISAEHI